MAKKSSKKTQVKKSRKKTQATLNIPLSEGPVGVLLYNMDDPYQAEDFQTALDSGKIKAKLDSLYSEVFRPYIKYGTPLRDSSKELTELELEIIEIIWDKINSHLYDD